MTRAEKIAEVEELRALAVISLKKAMQAVNYSVHGRSKQMASVPEFRKMIREYDQELALLRRGGEFEVSYGAPK